MSPSREWEAAEVAASLTTYIVGIEETLKQPMMQASAYLIMQVDEIYAVLEPIVGAAIEHAHVNLPGESVDD